MFPSPLFADYDAIDRDRPRDDIAAAPPGSPADPGDVREHE